MVQPTVCRARCRRAARSRSSGCCAVNVRRRRAVPAGTVGGRIATTRKPSSSSSARSRQRRFFVADHDRHDRALRFGKSRAAGERLRLGDRQRRIGRLALDQVERGDRGGDARRRQAGRIDQRAGAVAHQIDDRRRRAEIAAIGADRLRQRAHLQRHGNVRIAEKLEPRPPPTTPMPVGVVGHQPGVVLPGKRQQVARAGRDRRPWRRRHQ